MSKICDNIKISSRQYTLFIAEMIRTLFNYDVVFSVINVLLVVNADCRVFAIMVAHMTGPAKEADSTICSQRHDEMKMVFAFEISVVPRPFSANTV